MAVRIRLKQMGRRHRTFYRICAMDQRTPRDGRVLEELGTYDPKVGSVHARAILNGERIKYWLSVGAQPTEKVRVLIKKYGTDGTHLSQQKVALEHVQQPRQIPDPGPPASRAAKAADSQQPPRENAAQAAAEPPAAEPPTATDDTHADVDAAAPDDSASTTPGAETL